MRNQGRMMFLFLTCSGLSSIITFLALTPTSRIVSPVQRERYADPIGHMHNPLELHHQGESVEAEKIAKNVRIFCLVFTTSENHQRKAVHIKATWGKRCNKLIFVSSQNNSTLGAIDIDEGVARSGFWGKTKKAFKYVFDYHLHEYDWFFKSDHNTYVIMENMRYMLSEYDPNSPFYFGLRFKKFTDQGYMSAGGGCVLSREAVRKFVEEGLPNEKKCKGGDAGTEDIEMGICLENLGVVAGDSRDNLGRERFFAFTAATHIMGKVPEWFSDYIYYKPHTGLECCSDRPITFHYGAVPQMYELEYYLYHVRPYGIVHQHPKPAPLPSDTDHGSINLVE